MTKRTTKNALLMSILSLILCMSMLVSTTFAWFTDEVTSGVNKIVAGNLDVEVYYGDPTNKVSIQGNETLFNDVTLWEPGAVAYENLTVVNEGNLALKYQLSVNFTNENTVGGYGLSQVLKVAVVENGFNGTREEAMALNGAILADFALTDELAEDEAKTYGIVIWWAPSEADNNWNVNNGKTTSDGQPLHIDLGVKLVATQLAAEEDAFDKYYDGATPWYGAIDTSWYNTTDTEFVIGTAEELAGLAAITNGAVDGIVDTFAGKTIKLASNIDLNNQPWTPIADPMSENFVGFEGTFDGCGFTISNLNINNTAAWGQGLFGYLTEAVTIQNLNARNATVIVDEIAGVVAGWFYKGTMTNVHVTGNVTVSAASYVGGIAGQGYFADINKCSVKANTGSTITGTTGSFVGGIVGYQNDSSKAIADCQVSNLNITGYGAVGGIAGIISSGSTLSSCTVENVVLTKTRVDGNPSIGALVGCYSGTAPLTLAGNTVKNVALYGTHVEYSAFDALCGSAYNGATDVGIDTNGNVVENLNNYMNVIDAVTPADIQSRINTAEAGAVLTLIPGEYGTIVMKSGITLVGSEGTVVDCINLNGANGVTLKSITFDAAGAQGAYYKYNDNKIQTNANIISAQKNTTVGARNVVIEGCSFTGTFANGGTAIFFGDRSRPTGGSGNVTIKNCYFETVGAHYDIYSYYTGHTGLYFAFEGNTFASNCQGKAIYLGRLATSEDVIVNGNNFLCKDSLENAVLVQPSGETYTPTIVASDNTFGG